MPYLVPMGMVSTQVRFVTRQVVVDADDKTRLFRSTNASRGDSLLHLSAPGTSSCQRSFRYYLTVQYLRITRRY